MALTSLNVGDLAEIRFPEDSSYRAWNGTVMELLSFDNFSRVWDAKVLKLPSALRGLPHNEGEVVQWWIPQVLVPYSQEINPPSPQETYISPFDGAVK